MKKVLIVGPAWVGDMVMAHALFQTLKKRDQNLEIDVLAPSWTHPLLDRMPEIQTAIQLPIGHGELALEQRYQLGQTLKQKHYDQAILLPNSWKSALIPWFAKIPLRTGWRGEMRYGLLNDVRHLIPSQYPRMVERFVALGYPKQYPGVMEVPLPKLHVDPQMLETTLAKLKIDRNNRQPILAICAGAEYGPSKRWPESYYAKVIVEKINAGYQAWLLGSKNDIEVSNEIQRLTQGRCLDFTGRTSLGEAIDLLSLVTGVVANDSGLMHIAASLEKPLVAIYGSTAPGFAPPLTARSQTVAKSLPCSPCRQRTCPLKHHHCMTLLPPETIMNALTALGL